MPTYMRHGHVIPAAGDADFSPNVQAQGFGKSCWIASCAAPATAPSSAWLSRDDPLTLGRDDRPFDDARTMDENSPP